MRLTDEELIEVAERPRTGDWSMRAALVRLAQPEPVLAAELLEQVRRLDAVLAHTPAGQPLPEPLREVALELDGLADTLAGWADAGPDDPPTEEVAVVARRVRVRLDGLGAPVETRPPRRARP